VEWALIQLMYDIFCKNSVGHLITTKPQDWRPLSYLDNTQDMLCRKSSQLLWVFKICEQWNIFTYSMYEKVLESSWLTYHWRV